MNLSVHSQCDKNKYFSISTIDAEAMKNAGLKMTKKELREKAKNSAQYIIIYTGEKDGKCRRTKVYKYEDFKDEQDIFLTF